MYPNAQGRSRWWVPPHSHSPPQCVAHSSGNSNSRAVRSHVYPAPSASSPRKKACVSARSAVGRSAGSQDNILRTSRSAQRETPTPVGSLAASCAISASSVHSHDSSAATSDRGGMTQSSSMARMRTASSRVSSPAPRRRRSMPARTGLQRARRSGRAEAQRLQSHHPERPDVICHVLLDDAAFRVRFPRSLGFLGFRPPLPACLTKSAVEEKLEVCTGVCSAADGPTAP